MSCWPVFNVVLLGNLSYTKSFPNSSLWADELSDSFTHLLPTTNHVCISTLPSVPLLVSQKKEHLSFLFKDNHATHALVLTAQFLDLVPSIGKQLEEGRCIENSMDSRGNIELHLKKSKLTSHLCSASVIWAGHSICTDFFICNMKKLDWWMLTVSSLPNILTLSPTHFQSYPLQWLLLVCLKTQRCLPSLLGRGKLLLSCT